MKNNEEQCEMKNNVKYGRNRNLHNFRKIVFLHRTILLQRYVQILQTFLDAEFRHPSLCQTHKGTAILFQNERTGFKHLDSNLAQLMFDWSKRQFQMTN